MHKLLLINIVVGSHLYLRSALFGSIKVVDEQVEARKYVNVVAHNCQNEYKYRKISKIHFQ